ncbi:hypothetical protein [Streptomyces sp. TP-A0356]|uniref:hypothetical protein n=1 Tax=Streptomyces sp. TP-A0356 TaxID=1359208 RepID=UPI0006E3C263|nr:hypothetical protein [Streptomyces sp. TP-A0356]
MSESVAVRCPVCRREHLYAAPSYPCVCGAPVVPPLDRLREPSVVTHRTWDDAWVTVDCEVCRRACQWPHPELGCTCGTILRIPVQGAPSPLSDAAPGDPDDAPDVPPPLPVRDEDHGSPGADRTSPGTDFQPVTIRTTRDAVTAAALYLRRLGYHDIRRAGRRPPNGMGLAAHGILAQVDPSVRPASVRDVECLWLTAMSESARSVYFSLAGYADDARAVADRLGVPLFVLDLTGTPRPVNSPADELAAGLA